MTCRCTLGDELSPGGGGLTHSPVGALRELFVIEQDQRR